MKLFRGLSGSSANFTAIVLVIGAIAGCGGGGDSDSSGNSSGGGNGPGSTPPSYNGPTSPAPVNRDTVLELSRSLVAASSVSEMADSFWIDVEPGSSSPRESNNGSNGGRITVEVKSTGAKTSQVIIDFDDFSEEGVTASGRIIQDIERVEIREEDTFQTYDTGDQSFENFTLTAGDKTFSLHGTVDGSGFDRRQQQLDLILADRTEGQQLELQGFSVDKHLTGGITYSYFNVEIGGTLYDSALGKITISTERPMAEFGLEESRNYWRGHRNGMIRFEGEGEGALFGLTSTYAALMLDEDEDGHLETGTRVTWELLNNNEPFAPLHNNYPPISNPGNPFSSDERVDTFLHGLYSHDPDGNFLTYRWELVAKPLDSDFALEHPGTPYFSFQPDLAGDYVFNLHVSDGEYQSRSTFSLLVSKNLTNKTSPKQQLSAGLEVKQLDTAQPAFALDATSGLNGPWDSEDVSWSVSTPSFWGEASVEENNHTPHNTVASLSAYGHTMTARAWGQDFSSATTINSGDLPIVINARLAGAYGSPSRSVATADVNGDGAEDVISLYRADDTQNNSEIFLNKGDGTFTRTQSVPAGNKYLIAGDLNGDGRPEIVSSDVNAMVVAIQGDGGEYNTVERLPFPESPCNSEDSDYIREIGIKDLNGDGKEDLVALRACSELEVVYWPQGEHGLEDAVRTLVLEDWSYGSTLADVDNDGRIDVVTVHTDNGFPPTEQVWIHYNREQGFTKSVVDTSFNTSDPGLAARDLNGDGFAEIVILNGSYINILYRDDDGNFEEVTEVSEFDFSGSRYSAVRFADLDGNGRTDFLVTHTHEVQAIMNMGDNNFTLNFLDDDFSPGTDVSTGVADINMDGHPDIVTPGSSGPVIGYGDLTYYGTPQD